MKILDEYVHYLMHITFIKNSQDKKIYSSIFSLVNNVIAITV